MSDKKVLREGLNIVEIEGIVADIRIEEKKGEKDSITGEIDIKVKDDVHTVNIFSYKFNKEGKESGLYKGYATIMNEYKSIERNKDEADKVRIDTGKIGRNEYAGQDGLIKSYPQISANFINRLKPTDTFEPKAKFSVEMCVASVVEEKDRQGEETGRAILKGYVAGYEGRVFPFDFVVEGERAVNYVSNNYEKGTTVTVYGEIVNQNTVTKKEVEVGFGSPQEKIERKTIREYKVVSGSDPIDSDDDKALDPKLIKKGLDEREAKHKVMIEKKKNTSASNNNNSSSSPFVKDKGKPVDIDFSDLPF